MRPALIAHVALTSALGALISSFAAGYVAQQTFDVRAGVVLRAVLVTVLLLLVSWFAVRTRLLATTRGGLRRGAVLGLVLGYALAPTTWGGRAYAAQLIAEPGAATIVLDLVLWLVVGGTTALVASAPASAREPATYAGPR